MFIPAILTVFLFLMIIYILAGQSKLKALITTMALQRVRAVEALNTDRQIQNCNSRLINVEDIVILGRHKILCLTKFESIHWEYTFIQTNR